MAPGLRPRVVPVYEVRAAPRYSLDGNLAAHVLKDGANPALFKNWDVLVKCADWDDVETWAGYLGTIKFFIFHWHDAAAHNSYTQRVLINRIGEMSPRGTSFNVINLPIHLLDATVR
jgi:hypothetical protein